MAVHWRDPKPDKPGCYMHNHRRSAAKEPSPSSVPQLEGGTPYLHLPLFLCSLLNHLSSSPSPPTRRLRCKCLFLSLGSISTPKHTPLTMLLSPSIIPWVSHCPNILLLISSYSLPPPIPTPFFHQFSSLSSSIYFVPVLRFFHFPLFFAYSSYVRFVSHFSNGLVLFYLFILSQ